MNNKVRMLLIGLILLAMFSMAANAYQGKYMICWTKDRGQCGSCMYATAKQARDAANQINRETGSNYKFTIRGCTN